MESKLTSSELYYAQSHQLDPLGSAVVKSVIEVFTEEQIIEKSQQKIHKFKELLQTLNYPFIRDIRSYGMIFSIQIKPYNEMSAEELILKIKNQLLDAGIIIGFNLSRAFIYLLFPLNIPKR